MATENLREDPPILLSLKCTDDFILNLTQIQSGERLALIWWHEAQNPNLKHVYLSHVSPG